MSLSLAFFAMGCLTIFETIYIIVGLANVWQTTIGCWYFHVFPGLSAVCAGLSYQSSNQISNHPNEETN